MITIIVGKLGVGKTAESTLMIWKLLTKGKDCYANWEIDFSDYYKYRTTGWRGILWKYWIILTRRTRPVNFGKLYYWNTLEKLYTIRNGEVINKLFGKEKALEFKNDADSIRSNINNKYNFKNEDIINFLVISG